MVHFITKDNILSTIHVFYALKLLPDVKRIKDPVITVDGRPACITLNNGARCATRKNSSTLFYVTKSASLFCRLYNQLLNAAGSDPSVFPREPKS